MTTHHSVILGKDTRQLPRTDTGPLAWMPGMDEAPQKIRQRGNPEDDPD